VNPPSGEWSLPTQAVPYVEPSVPPPGGNSGRNGAAHSVPDDAAADSGGTLSAIGSKLTAAGAAAVAAATSAATTAREAVSGLGSSSAGGTGTGSAASNAFGATAYPSTGVPGGYGAPGPVGSPGMAGTTSAQATATSRRSATSKSGRAKSTSRQPRKARLTLSHINVYSVFKLSCVLAIALFFVWLIMVGVLYGVLDVAGVFTKINDTVGKISGGDNPKPVVTGSLVFGSAIIIGAVYIVLFIALSTIGSMVYNLCADLVGGVELTLSERE
jgi:Transmembrane domain of unknown function (DUF3566)